MKKTYSILVGALVVVGVALALGAVGKSGTIVSEFGGIQEQIGAEALEAIKGNVANIRLFAWATAICVLAVAVIYFVSLQGISEEVKKKTLDASDAIKRMEEQKEQTEKAMNEMQENTRISEKLEDYTTLIQSQSDLKEMSSQLIESISRDLDACQGAFFITTNEGGVRYLKLVSSYAYNVPESQEVKYEFGEGLGGQVAKEKKMIHFDSVPEGYIKVLSGLGDSKPSHLVIVPLIYNEEVMGVIEVATFKDFTELELNMFERLTSIIGAGINLLNQRKQLDELMESTGTTFVDPTQEVKEQPVIQNKEVVEEVVEELDSEDDEDYEEESED